MLKSNDIKIEILRRANDGQTVRQIAQALGIGKSTVGDFLTKKTFKSWWSEHDGKPIAAGAIRDHHKNIKKLHNKKYILTSAQNSTYVFREFLQSLEMMSEHIDAQLIVGTYSYNKSAFQNLEKGDGEWFDPLIVNYILDEPVEIAPGLIWCGELNILPTATNPFSGMQSYTKNASGIFPHAKMQLESIPTHKQNQCRMLYSTGTVTKRNYIQKKAGQKASFHHIFGALLVEVDDEGNWFVRQLQANESDGSFQDLTTIYHPDHIEENVRVEAINWGDIHTEKLDKSVYYASFSTSNPDSMLDVLKPRYTFFHDILDFSARNHHNLKDPYHIFSAYINAQDSIEEEIEGLINVLSVAYRPYCENVVVESNHDLALSRWLREADYKNDPENAIFFLRCQLRKYESIQNKEHDFMLLEWLVNERLRSARNSDPIVTFLRTDESFKICNDNGRGIECGSHGHLGANGARGGVNTFTKLDSRYNVGHMHSAAIKDGVYVAGHCMDIKKVGYAKGPSSWSHSHIITYPSGARTIVTIKNGKWRA